MSDFIDPLRTVEQYNPRRVLIPWGPGREYALTGSGLLVTGMGCVTYASAFETTGSASASVSIFDGGSANGQQLIDYTLTQGESTSEILDLHLMQFNNGLYVSTLTGSAAGTLTAWVDHDCAAYNGAQYQQAIWQRLQLELGLQSLR